MTLARQTVANQRKFENGSWGPMRNSAPIPTVGDQFGTEINEVQINRNSFVAFPVAVKPGQALSWCSISVDLGSDRPFNCALSHSDQMIEGAIEYDVMAGSNAPASYFKDKLSGPDMVDPRGRNPVDIDTSKPLFILVWGVDPNKAHKCVFAFTNGNSPRG